MNTPRTDAIAAKQRNINAFELVEVYNLMLEHARQLERENAELRKDAGECVWTVDYSYEGDTWDGCCGAKWTFTEGGPAENNLHFCPECGKKVFVIDAAKDSK